MKKRLFSNILTNAAATILIALAARGAGAFVGMTKVPNVSSTDQKIQAYEFTNTITTFASIPSNFPYFGPWVMVPAGIMNFTVTVTPGCADCKAKVQTTTDSEYAVQTDTNNSVAYSDWPSGIVTSTTTDSSLPVTAVRLVLTSTGTVEGSTGSATMSGRAN